MPERPWVTPTEVREYSEITSVQERTDNRIEIDISRAEQYVINYTNNDFSEYEELPASVKTAVILIAEAYGVSSKHSAMDVRSETFDDYSYTVGNGTLDFENLGLGSLLDEYVKEKTKGNVTMRMTVL